MNDLILRAPAPAEIPRVLYMFGRTLIPKAARFLVAVRRHPIERFVGVLAGWQESEYERFFFACPPGVVKAEIPSAMINETTRNASSAGLKQIAYGKLLSDDEPMAALLRQNGFTILRSERFFHLPAELAERRVLEMWQKYQEQIPPTWHTESIRHYPPEAILPLIAPHRLMTTQELQTCWRPHSSSGFDLDLSSILFDGSEAFGGLLARRNDNTLCYDIRVVRHPNPRLRALGNLCLFRHCITHHDLSDPVRTLLFRGGEVEHKETANLAFRMGGTELPARHLFGKSLC